MTDTRQPTDDTWQPSDTELFTTYGDAFVPRRAEQVRLVVDLLADLPHPHVLDLCCGEGLLSEEYLRRSPEGRVTLLDGDEEMLRKAGERLARLGAAERHRSVRADIADRGWRTPGEAGPYGAVVTSLAVHHLDGDGKRRLYRDLHDSLLAPGGVFVMADLVEPTGPAARALAAAEWDRAVREVSAEAAAAFEAAEWNYYRLPEPDGIDQPSSVAEHLAWLREAGFAEVDLVWLYAGHAIFHARRGTA